MTLAFALDDVSNGPLDLGLGPGSEGFDAAVLRQAPWSPAERLARIEELLPVLTPIVESAPATRTSIQTTRYIANEAPSTPGALQRPPRSPSPPVAPRASDWPPGMVGVW